MNPRKYTLPHIIYLSHRFTVSCLPLFYVSFFYAVLYTLSLKMIQITCRAHSVKYYLGFESLPLLRKVESEKNDLGAFNELPDI